MAFFILLYGLLFQSGHDNAKNGLAVEGYDVVSYFAETPLEGEKQIFAIYMGTTYRFANEGNKQLFETNPQKYVPQYGGWCAYAMGVSGDKVKVDPETFKILDGKLYLFYNFWGNNTLKTWNEDEQKLKADADKYWSDILATN